MSIYKLLDGGFSGACFNISYSIGAGRCEVILSYIYTIKGLHLSYPPFDFV